ncbi:hypothetical protein ACHQM5_019120 [Ranunculus cassubicifolius]
MEKSLSEAAVIGDIDALYAALASDPTILDRIDSSPFSDTPLHIAASAGQTYFALEMMILKPSLGRKLNHNGSTPMHLALKKEHGDELVQGLLAMNKELARVKGREGLTPLHCAVIGGRSTTLLKKMIYNCPESIMDLTTKGETALHLCAKSEEDCYNAFKFLVQVIESSKMDEVFSWLDSEGCSILHHLTKRGRYKVIVLVIAALFQVGLNPPGGFWQEDKDKHIAGSPIIASKDLGVYVIYTIFVSIGLLIALLMTKALTRGMPMAGWLQFSLLVLYSCYLLTLSQPVADNHSYYWYYPLGLFSVYFIDNMDLRTVNKFVKRMFQSIRGN